MKYIFVTELLEVSSSSSGFYYLVGVTVLVFLEKKVSIKKWQLTFLMKKVFFGKRIILGTHLNCQMETPMKKSKHCWENWQIPTDCNDFFLFGNVYCLSEAIWFFLDQRVKSRNAVQWERKIIINHDVVVVVVRLNMLHQNCFYWNSLVLYYITFVGNILHEKLYITNSALPFW